VTADEYLSGNVRQKLRDARSAADISPIFEPNVKALEKAQPKDLDASEIDVRLGATWVDKEYIQQFMHDLFEVPFYQRRAVQVQYSNFTSEWRISGKTSLSYRGFSMSVMYNPMSKMYQLTLKGAMSHQVELGSDARGNITRIDNALAGIPRRMQNVDNRLNDLNQQMATAKAELGKPFPQEEELRTKSARLAELDAKLNLDRPAAQAEKKKPEQER
jgi:hypothetical protein